MKKSATFLAGMCLAGCAALLVSPTAGTAQDVQRLQTAMNNVQQEMVECTSYYYTFSTCIGNSDKKTMDGMRGIADQFLERSAQVAGAIGMTTDAVASRLKMAQQDQFNLIKKDCVNISSLISRYQDRCELIWRDFKAVVNEYMK
jgi:hypothetical protein